MTIDRHYCTCSKGKNEGYKNLGNQQWVHSVCGKPAYLFWINVMLIEKYWKELDDIIERIIEKRELEDGLDKGRAETACLFIAMLMRPHDPDIRTIRNQAVKRYRDRNGIKFSLKN
jgi:hypothetical protein